jgi:2-C-methyl-D-erythritol 4-phosphate cytidylyltransferase
MISAIIVAAGKGSRMDGDVPKQYLTLGGIPIVSHSLLAFDACPKIDDIVLVVPQTDKDYCLKNLLAPLNLQKTVHIVSGGKYRQASVFNGLMKLDNKTTTVVIHDGVRPFVRNDLLLKCIRGAEEFGACILAIPADHTLKVVDSDVVKTTLSRESVWLAQTPQAFQYNLIMQAHETAGQDDFFGTDDALLLERTGHNVKVIAGSKMNIKITTKEDLTLAQAMLDAGMV